MKLIVKPHTIEIVKDLVNEKEIDITKCEFEFADEITDDYVKEAYFTYNGTTYKQIIQNNECKIPYEVLENKGMVEIGVVAYKLENDEYVKRYNPSPAYFNSLIGSLKAQYENSEPITPTDKEQIEQALNDGLNDIQNAINEVDDKIIEVNDAIEETNNLNINVNKVDKEATIELTKKDGTQKEVKIYDGVSLQFMWQGTSLGIKTDDMQDYVFVNLQGIQGIPGPQGEPFRIKKTYSSVAEMNADFNNMNYGDYVMIASTVEVEDNAKLYTRGELQWIFITDFSGATGIKGETGATPNIQIGSVTSGDTPNVTRTGTNENPILNFTLVKGDKGNKGDKGDVGLTGNGISSVRKTSTSGLVDTYTITFTNGTTTTFDITNGEDGEVTQEQLDKVQAELDYYKMLENALPKVEGEGETIHLEDTAQCPMKLGFKGQIQQDSTSISGGDEYDSPSPNHPQDIHIVSGDNEIKVCNKNLFDKNSVDIIQAHMSVSGHTIKLQNLNYIAIFPCKPSTTYTLQKIVSNRSVVMQSPTLLNVTSTTQTIQNVQSFRENTSGTLTTENDTNYMYFEFYAGDDLTEYQKVLDSIQIEKGSTATSYVEHREYTKEINLGELEVGGIGEYEDEFFKNTIDSEYYDSTLEQDKWYLKKRIGKVVLDGSEEWYRYTYTDEKTVMEVVNINDIEQYSSSSAIPLLLSNYFKSTSQSGAWNIGTMSRRTQQQSHLYFTTGAGYTIETFKTWLSTHNTTVYYVLATPTNTLLNDTLQETLDSFYSWQEQTNISQENNDLPFVIKASAIRDMTKIYDI